MVTSQEVAQEQPDELNALREVTEEFLDRLRNIDNEIETLKQDRKELLEEYKSKLDLKTLQSAIRVTKITRAIDRKDTFDCFLEVLENKPI